MSSNLIEQIDKMSVLELAALVKELQEKYGISAAMPVASVGVAAEVGATPAAEEKTEFKVTLKDAGVNKVSVIKALRSSTPFDLRKAKELAEGAPCLIMEAASKDDAKKIKEALEAAGAKVELS
jgi:large subunit ribosomal protein L7/L12